MDKQIAKKLDDFFKQFKFQTYKKGEMLIRADEDPSGIFYITQGIVKKYAISAKGDEVVVNLFKPVAFFPMSWAINDEKNNYFYEALELVEVWKAQKQNTLDFVRDNPDILFDLLKRMYRGLEGMQNRMVHLMSGGATFRLLTELIILAKRFGTKNNDSVIIKITEKDLATETGLTRETVSREIKKLKDKQLLSFEKNTIIISNIEKLQYALL